MCLLHVFLRAVIRRVTAVMSLMAERHAFHNRRTIACPCIIHCLFHRFVYDRRVIAVHRFAGDIISLCPDRNRIRIRNCMYIDGNTVVIIFAEENNRQLPCRRHVNRLMECPLIGCTVAKEAQRHMLVPFYFRCQRGTRRNGYARAYNTICAKAVQPFHIGNVHGAAFALAVTCFFAEQLRKHFVHIRTLRNAVPMPAVGRSHIVVFFQRVACACRHCLLPDAQVDIACQHPFCKTLCCPRFKRADTQHHFVHTHQHFLGIFFFCQCDSPFLFSLSLRLQNYLAALSFFH